MVRQSDASDAQRAFEDPSFLYRGGLIVALWGRTRRLTMQRYNISGVARLLCGQRAERGHVPPCGRRY